MAEKVKEMGKKALPFVAIGVGLLLVVIIAMRMMSKPATVGGQVGGVPSYDNYQANYGRSDRDFTPEQVGYTLTGAITPAPVCDEATGNCNYATALCGGPDKYACLEPDAVNFAPDQSKCPCIGCCVSKTYGCLDRANRNFNPWANAHDQRFCATVPTCNPAPVEVEEEPVGIEVTGAMGASVVPFDGGCYAAYDTPLLGGLKSCGNDWDLKNGNQVGAVSY